MWNDIRFSARDGVRLYGRRYGAVPGRRPLLCLPSLVGTSGEFDALAKVLAQNGPDSRTTYTIDCRGRGQSESGSTSRANAMLCDCEDVLDFMTLTGLEDAAVIGTGYGGQLAMVVALLRPHAVGALILNEAAPEFEAEGMVRMMGELASLPIPATWAEAASLLKSLHRRRYPQLTDAQWLDYAKTRFAGKDGRPAKNFDPAIAASFSWSRSGAQHRSLWPQFAAMTRVPMLLLRAEYSDMLGQATVARMRDLHPGLKEVKFPSQGHPVLLQDAASTSQIAQFLSANEWMGDRSGAPWKAVA